MEVTDIKHKTLDDYLTDESVVKCEKCRAEIKTSELAAADFICPVCGKYNRMPARVRIEKLTDRHSFHELFGDIVSDDPIVFSDYEDKYREGVIEQVAREKLPDNFQSAEFQLKNGFLDDIVPREQHREYIIRMLELHKGGKRYG